MYILKGKVPVAVDDPVRWGLWMAKTDRIVKRETIRDLRISTVFLGLDHQYGRGPPLLFESLVFWEYEKPVTQQILGIKLESEALEGTMRRYSTWEEAEVGHEDLVREARLVFLKEVNEK